jgi:hypothetical protein
MLGAGGRHRGDEGGGSNALGPSWEGVTGMSDEGGSAWRRLNLDKGMGKNRGQARRTLKEEERGAVAQRATRGGGGGAPDGRHGAGTVEASAGRATHEQERRGWRGPGHVDAA